MRCMLLDADGLSLGVHRHDHMFYEHFKPAHVFRTKVALLGSLLKK